LVHARLTIGSFGFEVRNILTFGSSFRTCEIKLVAHLSPSSWARMLADQNKVVLPDDASVRVLLKCEKGVGPQESPG
jgi:hypothetical protein